MPQAARRHVQAQPEPDSYLDPPSDMDDASTGEPGTELEELMVDADADEADGDDMDDEAPGKTRYDWSFDCCSTSLITPASPGSVPISACGVFILVTFINL